MIVYRKALISEASTIAEFQLQMAMESEGLSLNPEEVKQGVLQVFEDGRWGQYFVGELGGRLVCSTLIQYEWSDWRNAIVWWIHSVYVIPEYRRKGVFRAMFHRIRQEAEVDGNVKGLRLYVEKSNQPAQQCYEALGMTSDRYSLYELMLSGK